MLDLWLKASLNKDLDYHDTLSHVVQMVTVRFVIALAASFNWSLLQMDVYNVFLQGDLFEGVYIDLPPGFGSQGILRFAGC